MSADLQAAKDAHHFVKLALMNLRLLEDLEDVRGSGHPVAHMIAARAQADSVREPVSLLHQATFLQFGYVALVWLRESVREHLSPEDHKAVDARLEQRLSGVALPRGSGPRTIDSWPAVVRLVRNAISHARVEADDTHFTFTDHDKHSELRPTSLRMTWATLGVMSEQYLGAVQDVLYPS